MKNSNLDMFPFFGLLALVVVHPQLRGLSLADSINIAWSAKSQSYPQVFITPYKLEQEPEGRGKE